MVSYLTEKIDSRHTFEVSIFSQPATSFIMAATRLVFLMTIKTRAGQPNHCRRQIEMLSRSYATVSWPGALTVERRNYLVKLKDRLCLSESNQCSPEHESCHISKHKVTTQTACADLSLELDSIYYCINTTWL